MSQHCAHETCSGKNVWFQYCVTCVSLFSGIVRNYKLLIQFCGQFVLGVQCGKLILLASILYVFPFACVWSSSHLVLMLRMSGTILPLPIYFHGMLSDLLTALHYVVYLSFLLLSPPSRNINDPSAHVIITCNFNIFIFYLFVWCS